MFSGSGTTSTKLTSLIYSISLPENAVIQTKLAEEVLGLPADGMLAVRNNSYINAAVKDALCLYPTIISTLAPNRDGGVPHGKPYRTFSPGTVVEMQNYVHHRDHGVVP